MKKILLVLTIFSLLFSCDSSEIKKAKELAATQEQTVLGQLYDMKLNGFYAPL